VKPSTAGRWAAAALAAGVLAHAPAARGLGPEKRLGQCSVERWQVKDGLPGNEIRAIAQAADGQLWVATLGGVARYDGLRFTRVEVAANLKEAASDVRLMLAGRDGSVWLGSQYYPPLRATPGTVAALGPAEGLPAGQGTLALAEDRLGQAWMAGPAGVYRFADGRFSLHLLHGLEGRRPTALLVDAGGTPWLGTDRGLYSLDGDRLVPHPEVPVTAPISALHQDRRRVLWVAAGERLLGLDGGKTTVLGRREGLPGGPIAAMADDEDGNLWLGSPEGLSRVRGGAIQLFTARDGLPENDVSAVMIDREGSLWVGTRNGGLAQFTDRTLDTQDVPPVLDGVEVFTVCEDDEGAMWFGTRGRGVVRWKDRRATSYDRASGLTGDPVYAVLPDGPGAVWIGTNQGLMRWHAGALEDPKVWPGAVTALFRDHEQALWIGGSGTLGRLKDRRLTTYDADDGVPTRQVRAVGEDAGGHIWVSGVGEAGALKRMEGGKLGRTKIFEGRKISPVRSMLLDHVGAFWISAERTGLMLVDASAHARLFDAGHGLDAELLYQLLEDDAGDLWIGTSSSIARVSRSSLEAVADGRRPSLEVISFETTDRGAGVVAAEVRQPSAWKARDGRLWFLTKQGAVTVDPRRVRSNPVAPAVAIEAVLADGRALPADAEASLPPGPARLEVHYTARTLLEPSKARFRHRLEGVDADWVEAGRRRVASYAGLRAGSYRFRVQASNNDRLWNERGASFAFVIAPPFYRRYWFYAGCALALLPLAVLLYRARVARVRAQVAVMFAERTRVARELHDTLLQGMSGIAMQLASIRGRLADAPEEPRRELAQLQDTVAQALEETRRVVWDLRNRGESGGDLGPALSRFVRRLGRSSSAACSARIEGSPRHLPHAVEDELFRIAQEALRNAVKHAQASHIEARLRYDADKVVLTIVDDGRGFAAEAAGAEARGHFGLLGMRERAARVGATLALRSAPGQGTTLEVVVPTRDG
jgi:signal transduction histidine kinase/ligand-binding sensor domain-containing protein